MSENKNDQRSSISNAGSIEPDVYTRLEEQAKTSGVPLATLANLWLKERLAGDKAA